MNELQLIDRYPRLYHMAHDGAWPAIREHGLKSATALMDSYGVSGSRRHELESSRRPQSIALSSPGLPVAVLRDQMPMSDRTLTKCLDDGCTPQSWYELLNSYSFLWLSRARVWKLTGGRAYRAMPQTVLTIDTESLITSHRDRIRLSPINSGFSMMNAARRSAATFKTISEFPFSERAKTRSLNDNVVELLVEYSIPDIMQHVLAVHTVKDDKILNETWRRQSASDEDHP